LTSLGRGTREHEGRTADERHQADDLVETQHSYVVPIKPGLQDLTKVCHQDVQA
jgi:hypothetical protein